MKKPFLSKAAGSNGVFCWVSPAVSATKTDAAAAPEQCELRNLRKRQGNGKVLKRCMLCFVEVQVCEDTI